MSWRERREELPQVEFRLFSGGRSRIVQLDLGYIPWRGKKIGGYKVVEVFHGRIIHVLLRELN